MSPIYFLRSRVSLASFLARFDPFVVKLYEFGCAVRPMATVVYEFHAKGGRI